MTFEQTVDALVAETVAMKRGWRAVARDYTLNAWAEAEDRRCEPTRWLHDFGWSFERQGAPS